MRVAGVLALVSVSAVAGPPATAEAAATAYLNALQGSGDEAGRDLLLGGVTMTAQLFAIENWRIVKREPPRKEEGDLASAKRHLGALDQAGREALTAVLAASAEADGLSMTELDQAEAAKLMAPTREKAKALSSRHPVLAYVARVGKEVYWHPKNPIRPLLDQASEGRYTLELHLYRIETKEGPRQEPRLWPLRILRFKAGTLDTGWKILPASDWNAE